MSLKMLPSNVSGEVNRTCQASAGQKSNQKQKCQWILTFYSLSSYFKRKIAKKKKKKLLAAVVILFLVFLNILTALIQSFSFLSVPHSCI